MRTNHVLSLLQDGYTTVGCTFSVAENKYVENVSKLYTYKTNIDLKPNDIVVVPTVEGFNVVRVIEVHETPQIDLQSGFDYKWIIDKVDFDNYNQILEDEKEGIKQIQEMQKTAVRKQALTALEEQLGTGLPKLSIKRL